MIARKGAVTGVAYGCTYACKWRNIKVSEVSSLRPSQGRREEGRGDVCGAARVDYFPAMCKLPISSFFPSFHVLFLFHATERQTASFLALRFLFPLNGGRIGGRRSQSGSVVSLHYERKTALYHRILASLQRREREPSTVGLASLHKLDSGVEDIFLRVQVLVGLGFLPPGQSEIV